MIVILTNGHVVSSRLLDLVPGLEILVYYFWPNEISPRLLVADREQCSYLTKGRLKRGR